MAKFIIWDLILTEKKRNEISKQFDDFKTEIYTQIFQWLTARLMNAQPTDGLDNNGPENVNAQPIGIDNNGPENNPEYFV